MRELIKHAYEYSPEDMKLTKVQFNAVKSSNLHLIIQGTNDQAVKWKNSIC
jgi:hypothetical protein